VHRDRRAGRHSRRHREIADRRRARSPAREARKPNGAVTTDVRELIPLYALGILDDDEVRAVERAVAADPAIARELKEYQRTAEAIVAPAAPSPNVKARLMASIGGGRFEKFASRMAKLFDVSVDRAREFLGLIERPASWEPQIPGISLVHFNGGSSVATADCGFIRLVPGAVFPPHTHVGEEAATILSGHVRDITNDRLLGPGDDYVQLPGTNHYLRCEGDEECIFAVRAINGIEIMGVPARPLKRS